MNTDQNPTVLTLDEASDLLELPRGAVEGLALRGYLAALPGRDQGLRFQLSDVKAFLARNAENGAGTGLIQLALAPRPADPHAGQAVDGELDPGALVQLLDDRAEEMACRVFKIFSTVFPEAEAWPETKQGAFVQRAKGRFEAILAVTELGADVDGSLFEDLRSVGQRAARSSTPLPQLLVILRISRDLLIHNAVELADAGEGRGGMALSLLLTRILPAMDRLTDALAQGYWEESSR
jgi:hypothetical protein